MHIAILDIKLYILYMFKKLYILVIVLFFIFPSVIHAQYDTLGSSIEKQVRERIQKEIQYATGEMEGNLNRMKKEIQTRHEEMEKFKNEFKRKLNELKDERKKSIVEKISQRLAMINKNRTAHFIKLLLKMEQILGKIKTKTDAATLEGKNTTQVLSKIQIAQTEIEQAKTILNTQASKEYVISITNEASLKNDIQKITLELKNDLKIVLQAMQTVKSYVMDAAKALAQVQGFITPKVEGGIEL